MPFAPAERIKQRRPRSPTLSMIRFQALFSDVLRRHDLLSLLQNHPNMLSFHQILAQVFTAGLSQDRFTVARLIAFCTASDSSNIEIARLLFDSTQSPSAFAWITLIKAYSQSDTPQQSIHLFVQMLRNGIYPDKFTFPFLFKACTRLKSPYLGKQFHALVPKNGLDGDLHVQTSLLHMYAVAEDEIHNARKVFDEMPDRSTVTWNAVISCYLKSRNETECLVLFEKMSGEGLDINEDTLVIVLSACANLGALVLGKCVHGYVQRRFLNITVELGTGLVHMYSKCGNLRRGSIVFDRMSVRDVSTWTAMIGGLAMHGRGREAISLFNEMKRFSLRPDGLTFTNLLTALSHSGLVQEALGFFDSMKNVYRIEPRIEHCGCIMDLLARSGLLEHAVQFVQSMPMEPNGVIWGCLVNACLIHGELGLGEDVGRHVLGLGLDGTLDGSFYVIMSNIYARVGKWDEVRNVREMMVDKRVKKSCGYSLIEVDGRVHRFLVGDTTHPFIVEIYKLLHEITQEIRFA